MAQIKQKQRAAEKSFVSAKGLWTVPARVKGCACQATSCTACSYRTTSTSMQPSTPPEVLPSVFSLVWVQKYDNRNNICTFSNVDLTSQIIRSFFFYLHTSMSSVSVVVTQCCFFSVVFFFSFSFFPLSLSHWINARILIFLW